MADTLSEAARESAHVAAGAAADGVALRNAGWLLAQRGLHVALGVSFAVLVPRLMGPGAFGQYALVTSISMWFALLSGLGAVSTMTRAVPGFVVRGDVAGLQKLTSSLVAVRASTGLVAASMYLLVTTTWLRDMDVVALACIAGAVFSRTVANVCFALFLGLNRAARWGLGELLRRSLTLAFVLAGFAGGGLRGACVGFLAAHGAVLLAGVLATRPYLRWSALWPDLAFLTPFLRTGAFFAGGNLLLTVAQRTGEALVRISTGDYAEVGYFGVAYGMYLAGAQALWHLVVAFAPVLIGRAEQGEADIVSAWLERLVTWMTAAAAAAACGTLLAGDWLIPLLLGSSYLPVVRNVVPLALALVVLGAGSIGRLQALVADRPGVAAQAAAIELAAFWTVGPLLASRAGSFGACVAVLIAGTLNAAFITWRLRGLYPYPGRRAVRAILLAVPIVPFALLHGSGPTELLVLVGGLGAYVCLLRGCRVITAAEMAQVRRALRGSWSTDTTSAEVDTPLD